MRRPLVGITTYAEPARWGMWDQRAALLPWSYVDAVRRAGARVVLVPPDEEGADAVEALDGLVVAGGPDVAPDRYAAVPHPATEPPRPERDAAELALVAAALDRDLPLLGVCRGLQLLAVHAGGTLVQHLPDVVEHDEHRPGPATYGRHTARFAPGSLIAGILGPTAEVTSYHHQAVDDPGGLTVTGWAFDGTIEAAEVPGRRFALGVQWHPEADDDPRLFEALVTVAKSA